MEKWASGQMSTPNGLETLDDFCFLGGSRRRFGTWKLSFSFIFIHFMLALASVMQAVLFCLIFVATTATSLLKQSAEETKNVFT